MKGEGKVKKYEVALFLKGKGATDYTRIKKATELKLEFGASTQEYDYIADENPTIELDKYKPEISGLPQDWRRGSCRPSARVQVR